MFREVTLCLILQLGCQGNVVSESPCPAKCQCFTPSKVLCSEERMTMLPNNVSTLVTDFIVMTTGLAYLQPNTLQESPQLTKLVFLNNILRDVSPTAFENLTRLMELEISGNMWLNSLHRDTFNSQGLLNKLVLNFNDFHTVVPGLFTPLQRLESLVMTGNSISFLPKFLFQSLNSLRHMDLSQNKLRGLDADILLGLDRLQSLKINYNSIVDLSSQTFGHVSQLKELSLEGNRILDLPTDIFLNLTQLQVLNLRGNLISSFIEGIFPLTLTELNLKGNQLAVLSSYSLGRLTALTHLSLANNVLINLPRDVFQNLTALEIVDLSDNHLVTLPEGIFDQISTMKEVHLQRNALRALNAKLFEDQRLLQRLYLSENQLRNIPIGFFDHFLQQNIVRLQGNPWQCDCQMEYLYNWVDDNKQGVEDLGQVFCKSPASLKGQGLAFIDKEQLVCHGKPKDEASHPSNCTLQSADGAMVMKCNVTNCSPLRLKVQFQEGNGNVSEYMVEKTWPEYSQCTNGTITLILWDLL